ncbi:unnamed protein product [Protopolystoma xenopodis]|uniref:Uncharacterized protein n=1 Tax=Protopolystoma xenopodis TaxID=117903 RepID=A0A3S5BT54_9PLAT|nr:unnamed protein product [Protopolystoma xenopodis]
MALAEVTICQVVDRHRDLVYSLLKLDPERDPPLDQELFGLAAAVADRLIFFKMLWE